MLKNNGNRLYWHPLGGNNIDQISGHCYHYMYVSDKDEKTSIIIDIGKYDNHEALGVPNSVAAIPDVRFLLAEDEHKAKAIFLTHSHPDHLNGIVYYIKAGYKMPKIYGGYYTFLILKDLLKYFDITEKDFPEFIIVNDGDKIKVNDLEIEVLSSSHTCFDSFGFIIKTNASCVYHTGDMKIDNSTYFRKPTNIGRLKELSGSIDVVVADFCQIFKDGFTPKEVDTFKVMTNAIKKSGKKKIFIPVYPTHPEMYIIAFLAALKMKKNVIFYGSDDFYSYLELLTKNNFSFGMISKGHIKILYAPSSAIDEFNDNYVVIGDFNWLNPIFSANSSDSFAIVTARNFFNPLKKILNLNKIAYIDINTTKELQGYGHGFLEDYKFINKILKSPTFIPSHCPRFVVEYFRELAKIINLKMVDDIPENNQIYKICKSICSLIYKIPANWLIVSFEKGKTIFTEVKQIPTAGKGNIKSTISRRRCLIHIMACIKKEREGKKDYE